MQIVFMHFFCSLFQISTLQSRISNLVLSCDDLQEELTSHIRKERLSVALNSDLQRRLHLMNSEPLSPSCHMSLFNDSFSLCTA